MAKGKYKYRYCNFPGCNLKNNRGKDTKEVSIHTLPKNATKETVEKWAKVFPELKDSQSESTKIRYAKSN